MHFDLDEQTKTNGVPLTLIAITAIFIFWGVSSTPFFPATVQITLADASGEIIPTKSTDAFKVYLVQYPNEKDSEYIELTPGAEEDVQNGVYHLRVYCDEKRLPESKGVLLHDEKLILSESTPLSRTVQLDSIFIHYEIYATSPGFEYLLERPLDKVVIKTRF